MSLLLVGTNEVIFYSSLQFTSDVAACMIYGKWDDKNMCALRTLIKPGPGTISASRASYNAFAMINVFS